jgi:hypothetical protein
MKGNVRRQRRLDKKETPFARKRKQQPIPKKVKPDDEKPDECLFLFPGAMGHCSQSIHAVSAKRSTFKEGEELEINGQRFSVSRIEAVEESQKLDSRDWFRVHLASLASGLQIEGETSGEAV